MGNQGSIEFQVNLGLNTAEGQVNKLRELLKDAVNVKSSAFNGLTTALDKAEKQVADLRSKMQTAFQTAGGSKKFLTEYTKLFESLDSIGNRFSFLKEADVIFSPESSEELKSMRAEVAALEDSIKQIKSGKVGKLFEDDSVESIKQVREAADMVKVTLSNVTFQDFKQKLGAAMTETSQKIEETTKQINLLKEAAGSAQMKKDTIFSQLDMGRLMESSAEVLKSDGASTFREKIKQLYNEFGLNDIDLSKTVRAGTNLDQLFISEANRISGSTDKFVTKLEEEKKRVQEAIDNFGNIYKNTSDGKHANWQSKLAYTDEIRKQFEGLISFTEASPELRSTGKGIQSFVENFEKELKEGFANLSTSDVARMLQYKLQEIFQTVDSKVVITDLKDFQSEVQLQFGQIFKGIDLGDLTAGITKGWSFDKAIDQVLLNLQASIEKIDPSQLQSKLEEYKAALETLKGANATVAATEGQENGSLKEKEAAWQNLTDKILTYVQARLNAVSAEARGIGENDAPKINQTKTAIEQYIESLNKLEGKQKTLSGVRSAVTRWMGFYQVLNLTKRAINDMKQHIQELDTVMTQIAVVTNMSQEQLWGQISKYSEIARSYGVAIKGVYEVSQIYYQQGLESNDVMTLTTETLKMARIAGLDYATAADYMTTAIRGFKLEMTDAAHVTDVFSALAASTASSTEELAVAISKTAASAANVGSSFEATSAMMATMIATTRESATNIGTALKSIISRYGEMTSKPNATTDSEGEEMSLNRVDKALQTIGITLHTTTGEFRNFDEVILELAEKWDTLDSVSQRYIATIMAGNRQQSRFLALVSNVDEYKRALEVAEGSEGSGELQMLKTLDSVDAKLEKMRVTIQEFYTSSGLEQLYKNVIDAITNIISAANDMPKMFKNIPVQAIAVGTALISAIKGFLMLIVNEISMALEQAKGQTTSILDQTITIAIQKGQEAGIGYGNSFMKAMSGAMQGMGTSTGQLLLKNLGPILSILGSGFTISGLSKYGASTSADQDRDAGQTTGTGAVLGIAGSVVSGVALGAAKGSVGGVPGAVVGGVIGAITGLVKNAGTLATAWQQYNVTLGRQIELSEKAQEQAKQKLQQDQSEQKNLEQAVVKLQQLKEARYDSIEAEEEYRDYMNQLSETYPQLVDHMEQGGNAIIEVTALEDKLAAARLATANSTVQALKKEKDTLENYEEARENFKTQTSAEIIDNEAKMLLGRQIKGERSYSWDMSQEEAIVREYLEDHGQDSYEFLGDEQSQQATEKSQSYFATYQNEILKWAKEKGYFSRDNAFNKQHQGNLVDYIWSALDKYNKAMPDDKILEYFDVKSKADLEKLNFEDLYNLSQKISRFAMDLYNNTKEAITAVDESLINAEISEGVQDRLNQLRDDPETKNNADKLQKYASLMSFIYSGMGNALPEDDKMQELENYLLNNPIEADKLLSLDYSQFRTIGDLSFIPKVYRQAFEDAFTKARTAATEGLEQQTKELQLSELDSLFDDNTETNGELINALIPNLRDSLAKYRSLLDSKNVASAENYRKNMVDFYTKIAELSTDQQQQILSLVPDIDFADSTSLRSAAETIRALGPDYEAVAQDLENAANRWAGNAQLILAQVLETASDTAKAIENAFDNQGKTFKRSEALKNASELLASYTGTDKENLDWSDLYEYSEAAGGYIETQKAFEIRLANATSEATKNIQEAERAIGFEEITSKKLTPTVLNILQRDRNKARADGKTYKDIYGSTVGLQDENLDAAWAQFESISKAWEDLNDTTRASYADFAAYYQERLEKDQEELEKVRKEITNMPREMAQQYLKSSIDYKSIAGGTAAIGSEELLRNVLEKAGNFQFDQSEWAEIWAALVAGDFKKYNTLLANMGHANLGVSDNTGTEMVRAEYTQYSNALDEIIAKKPYEALSDSTQKLVGTAQDYNNMNVVQAAISYAARIQELFNQGQASIEEVNAAIVKAMNFEDAENGIGKQKKALDAAKDGFTNEELVDLGLVEEIKNEAGEIIGYGLKKDAQAYLEKDVLNGGWKATGSQSMRDVLLALNDAYELGIDITSKEWKDFIQSDIQQQITDLDAADIQKQAAAQVASLFSAKQYDRIDVSKLSDRTKANLNASGLLADPDGILYLQTEAQLQQVADMYESLLKDTDWLSKNQVEAQAAKDFLSQFKSQRNQFQALSNIISESVSKESAETFLKAFGSQTDTVETLMPRLGATFDEMTQSWIFDENDLDNIESYINDLEANDDGSHATAIAQMRASLENLRDTFTWDNTNAITNLLSNYSNLSNDAIATFNQYWGTELSAVGKSLDDFIVEDEFGNKKLDVIGLKQALEEAGNDVDELFKEVLSNLADNYVDSIKKAQDYAISGTTSDAEMSAFTTQLQEALGDNSITVDDAFDYDIKKGTWKLKTDYLVRYAKARAEQLKLIDDEYEAFVNSLFKQDVTSQIDSVISSLASGSIEHTDELQSSLEAYYMQIYNNAEVAKEQAINTLNDILGGGEKAANFYKFFNPDATESQIADVYSAAFDSWSSAAKQLSETTQGSVVTGRLREVLNELKMVDGNGVVNETFDMVAVYKEIYAKMASTAGNTVGGLNDAYAELMTAQDQSNINIIDALKNGNGMSYKAFGELLAQYDIKLKDYMEQSFGIVERDGFGNIRITDWEAFAKSIFKVEDLNAIKNTPEYISAFKAYNDGLIELNKNTEQAITDEIKQIENAKGGDWLNLTEFGTQYVTALTKSINLGDYLNLTNNDLGNAQKLQAEAVKYNEQIIPKLNEALNQWDASFEDGILKISDNANLLGIAQTLEQASIDAGLKIGEGLEEVQDAVLNVLKSYTEAITKGIDGGLSVTEQTDLIQKAHTLGVHNLSFEKTQDGLKLSQQSAIALYQALSKVDALQGKIVFDKLAESLQKTNENFATTTALLNHMVDLRTKLSTVDSNVPDSRRAEYEAELEIAKEIVAVRSAAEDSSFNFMDNKIPAGQNNPLNYAKNWTKAVKAIKDAYKVTNTKDLKAGGVRRTRTGYMGYEDFYNIINELNNMAGIMKQPMQIGKTLAGDAITLDGSLTSASDAIMHGINTLTAVDTGEMMVNIGALGINLAKGGKEFEKNIDAGIDAVADAQIHALDGLIGMLELIVAMEQLGDITGEDTTIDLGDIFAVKGQAAAESNIADIDGFTTKFEEARTRLFDYLNKAGNEEAKKIFENTQLKIGDQMKSMFDLMNPANSFETLFPKTLTPEQKSSAVKAYQGVIDGLYQAAISGNYNLDDIGGSLQEILNATGHKFDEGFMLNVGDITYTVQSGVVVEAVDWTDKTAQDILAQYKKKHEGSDAELKAEIVSQIQDYLNGKGQTGDLTVQEIIAIRHSTVIKHDKKGYYVEGPDGKQHYAGDPDGVYDKIYNEYILKDQQGIDKNAKIEGDTATLEYGKTVKITMKAKVQKDGSVQWQLDGDFASSMPELAGFTPDEKDTTQRALLEHMYAYATRNDTKNEGKSIEFPSVESWVYQKFGIHLKVKTEVLKDGETVEDPTKDPKFRNVINGLMKKSEEEIKTRVSSPNKDGKIEVDIGEGYKLVLDADDIDYDVETGTYNNDLLLSKMREAMGIDEALKDTITKAITEAFTELSTLLTTLDSSKVSELGTAFKTVYENVQAVATGLQQLVENLSKLTGVDIKIEFNLPDLPTGEEGDGISGEEADLEIPVNTKAKTNGGIKDAVQEEVKESADVAKEEAENIPPAIGEGASDTGSAEAAIEGQGEAIKDTFDEVMEIAPPSQVMVEKAKFVGEGIEQGLNESQSIVEAAAEALGQVIIDKIEETATKVSESIDKIVEAINRVKETELDIDTNEILNHIQQVQTALDQLSETKPKIEVNTANAEAQLEALKSKLQVIETTQKITPEGFKEDIDDFDTTQTINTVGGVYDIGDFTTYQTIITRGGGGSGCFVAGTKIYMADGTIKNIEDVYLNDVVIAYNPETNEFVPKKVIDGYTHHNTPRIVEVAFSDGTSLKMTPSHPILTTKGWRSLDPIISLDEHGILPTWLEIGDKVNGYYGEVEVINISELSVPKNYDTYDFEVEDCHTFLAEGIPVHNAMITGPAMKNAAGTDGGGGKAKGSPTWLNPQGHSFAKGNITGAALAGGHTRTLMGELGPELYVAGGRYYMAGQNGAEFVNLPDDAIVFNHMQTKSLMSKGQTGHGKPVTSERNAISWAKGNINGGPAMASASAALAALKQLRAMWQSLKNASISDLAGAGGGGGGGGGGGNSDKAVDPKEWVALVERWYNLTQKIAQAEKEITHEEQLRAKLQSDFTKNGQHYFKSQMASLKALKEQIAAQEQLNLSRQDYSDRRIEALRTSALGQLIDFDSNGQMLFRKDLDPSKFDGFTDAMEWRTWLTGYDEDHKARFSSQEKYEKLRAAGLIPDHVYDSNGKEITMDSDQNGEITDQEREDYFYNISKQVFDQMDEYQEAQQSLHDAIEDGKVEVLKLQEEQNKIWQEMRDNQMELEESVLKAIEDMKQREIDALQDERDKLEDSVSKYIQGLSDALDKEREMYDTEESQNELDMQKRRLAILQRSGASAADVSSLQNDILANERDLYFDAQQAQIDAIQDASDLEIARLDSQIAIMQETLDYQKEYGLLWYNVYDVMEGSAAEITSFIMRGNSEFWNLSPLGDATRANDTLFQAEQWTGYRQELKEELSPLQDIAAWARSEVYEKDFKTYDTAMKKEFGDDYDKSGKYKKIFDQIYEETGDLTKADAAARAQYTNDKLEEEKKRKAEEEARRQAQAAIPASGGNNGGGGSGCYGNCTGVCKDGCGGRCGATCKEKTGSGSRGKEIPICNGNCTGSCTNSCTGGPNSKSGGYISNLPRKTSGRASGGYVTHGLYELGERGTETVLTAQQTQVLRNNILSNRPSSLISLLKTYNEGFSRMETPLTGTTTEDNSTNIDKLEFSMNVQQISNDYDARRAGEQAMNEIMRIARKTSAANSIRR